MFTQSQLSRTHHNPTVRSVESELVHAKQPLVLVGESFTPDTQSHVTASTPKRTASASTYSTNSVHNSSDQQGLGQSLSGVTTRKRKSGDGTFLAASELSKLLQAAATCSIDAPNTSQEQVTSTTASRRGSHLTPPVSAEPQAEQQSDHTPRQETKRRRSNHSINIEQSATQPVAGPVQSMITTTRRSCGAGGPRRAASGNPAPPAPPSERQNFHPHPRIVGMTPAKALQVFARQLTEYERNEIQQYSPVWFVGPRARKIQAAEGAPNNCGYDDSTTRYLVKKRDHFAYRYEVIDGLGKGAFGDVYKVLDHATGELVALKVIRNERRFHRQGKIEVRVLEMLRDQDADRSHSLVHIRDSFVFRNHLCIAFEMHHHDLYTELKAGGYKGFDSEYIREIAGGLLSSLQLLYANNIVHADLKPENMLQKSPTDKSVVMIDFGSSCFAHQKVHTYIQSRYYRSPEVMLGLGYGTGIDMWSVGCILVELRTGTPLFAAKNEHELMILQTELLGVPPEYLLARATRSDEFFMRLAPAAVAQYGGKYTPLRYTDRKGRKRVPNGRRLTDVCGNDPLFVDFVRRCLTWDPMDRITPPEALNHPYVTMGKSSSRRSIPRCSSEDGLVSMITRKRPAGNYELRNPSYSYSSYTASKLQHNDSGVSSQGSDSDDTAMEHEGTVV